MDDVERSFEIMKGAVMGLEYDLKFLQNYYYKPYLDKDINSKNLADFQNCAKEIVKMCDTLRKSHKTAFHSKWYSWFLNLIGR